MKNVIPKPFSYQSLGMASPPYRSNSIRCVHAARVFLIPVTLAFFDKPSR